MQCVIFHTSDGTAVRQWSQNTLLNGQPFDNASVRVGDRLTLGSVELEFVAPDVEDATGREPIDVDKPDVSAKPAPVDQPQPFDLTGKPADPPGPPGIADSTETITPENLAPSAEDAGESWPAAQEVFRHLQAANEINRHRARKLLSTLRKHRRANVQLESRVGHLQRQLDQLMHEAAKRDALDSDHAQKTQEEHGLPPAEGRSPQSQVQTNDPVAEPTGTADPADSAQGPHDTSTLVPSTLPDNAPQPSEPWRHVPEQAPQSTAPQLNAGGPPRQDHSPDQLPSESEAQSTEGRDDWLANQVADIEHRGKDAAPSSGKSPSPSDVTEGSPHRSFAEPKADEVYSPSPASSTQSRSAAESEEYFRGFSKSAATVDQELLGPLPKLRRPAARLAPQPSECPPGLTAAPDEAMHVAPPDDIPYDRTGSAADGNREDAALPVADDPPLPGANTPSTPGLSDSAVEHLRKLSIWKGDPDESSDDESGPSVEATPTAPSPTVDATSESAEPDTPQSTSTSFLERYAPMLAGMKGEEAPPTKGSSESLAGVEKSALASNPPSDSPSAPSLGGSECHQDDESIEEYMAKLMQRVRGESASAATPAYSSYGSNAPSSPESSSGGRPVSVPDERGEAASTSQSPDAEEQTTDVAKGDEPALLTLDELKRSGPVPEHATDMKALRELANQTARHAIGVHASRKHRESALSRLIMAGFALISGLFLILTSSGGLSLKFVAGSIASIAALYWGLLTLRSLFRSMRPGTERARPSDPFNPPLPIAGKDETVQRGSDVHSEP